MFKKFAFKNHLRVIAIPMRQAKTVSVLVMVQTGSEYETKNISGVSHFLEHMVFKGTRRWRNAKLLSEAIDKVGGEHNAFTDRNVTGYWVKVPPKYLALALQLTADMFSHATIHPREVERERLVILEELNMGRDTPMRHVWDVFGRTLWGDQPAGWPIGGTLDTVRAISRADIVRYWKAHYTLRSTIVCVAGAIKPRDVKALATRYFGSAATHEPLKKSPVAETQTSPNITIEPKNTDQTHFVFGARAFPIADPRRVALGVLVDLLGGMASSRLFLRIRDTLGLAYYIRMVADLDKDAGFAATSAGISNGKCEKTVEEISKIYASMKRTLVSRAELKKAKEHLKGQFLLELETSDALAHFFGEQEAIEGKIATPEEQIRAIDKVTAKDLRDLSRFLFRPERMNIGVIGPGVNQTKLYKTLVNI